MRTWHSKSFCRHAAQSASNNAPEPGAPAGKDTELATISATEAVFFGFFQRPLPIVQSEGEIKVILMCWTFTLNAEM